MVLKTQPCRPCTNAPDSLHALQHQVDALWAEVGGSPPNGAPAASPAVLGVALIGGRPVPDAQPGAGR